MADNLLSKILLSPVFFICADDIVTTYYLTHDMLIGNWVLTHLLCTVACILPRSTSSHMLHAPLSQISEARQIPRCVTTRPYQTFSELLNASQ